MDEVDFENRLNGLAEEFREYKLAQTARINGLRHAVATALVAVVGQGGKLGDIADKLQALEANLLPDTHMNTSKEIAAFRQAIQERSAHSFGQRRTGFQNQVE